MRSPDSPLDLIILADLTPGVARRLDAPPRRVDKSGLDEMLAELAPEADLSEAGVESRLRFPGFRSFQPPELAAALPVTRDLLALRRLLEQLSRGRISSSAVLEGLQTLEGAPDLMEAVRSALAGRSSPTSAPPPAADPDRDAAPCPERSDDPLDSIFEMVDTHADSPQASADRLASGLDRLMEDVVGLARSRETPPAAVLSALMARVDEAIGGALRKPLHSGAFLGLESTWQGLRFLVRRTDLRSGTRLFVLNVPASEAIGALRESAAPFARGERAEGRTPVVLIDHAFGAQEIGRLAEIAAEAEENHLPVIASLAASALGLSRLGDFGSISDLGGAMAANAEWTALRGSEASRWLALVLNGFLLRFPYGAETDPTAGLDFEENPPGEEPVYLWGRPGWILGALLTDSFARTGWGAGITGPQSGGRMDDLPVRLIQRPPRELVQIPLETLLPENRLLEISLAGIIPLACKRNSDAAFVMTAPTVRLPQGKDAEERRREAQRTTLPFQMMTVQILGTVEAWLAEADPKSEPSLLAASLAAAFRRASPLLDVSAGSSVGAGGKPRLVLNARPVGDPLKGLPDVQLDFTLPGP